MSMSIRFTGGKVVTAETKGFTITTDVPTEPGGAVTAPSPVDLLLAALGNCTSYYVLHFCQSRDLPIEDVSLSVDVTRDEEKKMIDGIAVSINIPNDFPDKYVEPMLNAASQCTVKKLLQNCPTLETVVVRGS
jgi:putative redox protein